MDQKSVTKLRIDRRLIGRRGWISKEDLEEELAKLPDAAGKATTHAEAGASEPAPGASAPSGSGATG